MFGLDSVEIKPKQHARTLVQSLSSLRETGDIKMLCILSKLVVTPNLQKEKILRLCGAGKKITIVMASQFRLENGLV